MAKENFRGLSKIHDHRTSPKGGPTSPSGPQYGPIKSPHPATAPRGEFRPAPRRRFSREMRPSPLGSVRKKS
jgi:hypothetical protein